MAERCIVIDGHNVIHSWPELAALHQNTSQRRLARLELTRRVARHGAVAGVHLVLVYDGVGGRRAEQDEEASHSGLQVLYSGAGRTADDVIEALVRKYALKYQMEIVTDDRLQQDQVIAHGGLVCTPRHFLKELQKTESQSLW